MTDTNKTPDSVDVAQAKVNKVADDSELSAILDELCNQVEWSVQVPGAVAIDRDKENTAKNEAITALHKWRRDSVMGMLPEKFTFTEQLHRPVYEWNHEMSKRQGFNDAIERIVRSLILGKKAK